MLEILIPTLPDRRAYLDRLLAQIQPQLLPGITAITDDGPGTIGAKRQRMMESASADYIVFIDDDDRIAPDYVQRIHDALQHEPDVVGITIHVSMDGRDYNPIPIFRHSLRYADNIKWQMQDRTPHHLCPLRRQIAMRSRFPDKSWGEDYDFALGVLPYLHQEVWSGNDPIYFYEYRSGKATEPVDKSEG